MKVLHSALMLRPMSGIINQMQWEQNAASNLGLEWNTAIFCPKNNFNNEGIFVQSKNKYAENKGSFFKKAGDYINFRKEYYEWLDEQSESFDVLVLRYSVSDPFQTMFVRRIKKPVYLVHHTLEVPELFLLGGIGGFARIISEYAFGVLAGAFAKGLVGVTNEIIKKRYQLSGIKPQDTYMYPNGILLNENSISSEVMQKRENDVPEILFAASYFSPWHGLDLLLDDILNSKEKFKLHLVGNLSTTDQHKAENDERIILHGHMPQKELVHLLRGVDIGLSSFALKKKMMMEACTLKTREYLAEGIPVYAGHKDVFPNECKIFENGRPEIKKILNFHECVKKISKNEVLNEAKPYIDKKILLKNFYDWLYARHGTSHE